MFRQLSVLCAAVFLSGCATQKLEFRHAPSQPAAQAVVKVSLDKHQNANLRVDFEHLAPPARLVPPRAFYVLWAESPQGTVAPIGQFVVGRNFDGSFRGSTTMNNFRLVITAEDFATPASPNQPHVMTTEFIDATSKKWYQMR
jgi:hypothetical protein